MVNAKIVPALTFSGPVSSATDAPPERRLYARGMYATTYATRLLMAGTAQQWPR